MILTADYHTHTVFSHGKGTILENALSAKEKGLKEIGISDHGFAHPVFGLSKRKIKQMRSLCDEATLKTGVNVLLGIESNITGIDGKVDLKPKYYDYFDIFLAGLHKFVLFDIKTFFSLSIPDITATYFKKKEVSKSLKNRNTKTFINVIKNNPVDAITHLNFFCFADAKAVAETCAEYGTYLELNAKKTHLLDEEIQEVLKTDVRFIISSDAHGTDRVGEISLVQDTIKRLNIPLDRIDNIDGRIPDFRFKKFKEGLK